MADKWKRVSVSEVCELIVDCVNKTAPVVEEDTPYKMLRTTNIKGGRIDREECRRVSKDTFVKWTRRADVRRGDVILTREAPLGEVGYVDFDDTVFLGQRLMQYRANRALLEPRFLVYSFLSKDLQNQFGAHEGSGSTVSHIRVGDCSKFQLSLPPIAEQKAIAAILGALDDKIELNRRMNATLEAMARALFQSWFVDFDPVRAKLDVKGFNSPRRNGEAKGFESPDLHLFPDSFQDSELGPIPKGWTAQRLPDAIEVNPRRSLKRGTIAPYLDMKNLPTQGHSAEEVIHREFSSGTKFQNGDTLLARITPCLENGKTGYVDFLEDGQIGWGSTEYIVFAPKPPLPAQYAYLLARSDALRTHAIQNMTGTSGRQRVPSECFNTFWLAVPPPNIAHRFNELTAPLMAKIKANSNESRTLATLRDTLLPKLLSGALSVSGLYNMETELPIGPAWLNDYGGLSILIDGHVFSAGDKYTILEMGWAVFLTEETLPADWWRRHGETRPAEGGCNELTSGSGMLMTSHPVLVALALRAWWHNNGHPMAASPHVKVPGCAEAVAEVRQRKILNDFNARFGGEVPGLKRWQSSPSGKERQPAEAAE